MLSNDITRFLAFFLFFPNFCITSGFNLPLSIYYITIHSNAFSRSRIEMSIDDTEYTEIQFYTSSELYSPSLSYPEIFANARFLKSSDVHTAQSIYGIYYLFFYNIIKCAFTVVQLRRLFRSKSIDSLLRKLYRFYIYIVSSSNVIKCMSTIVLIVDVCGFLLFIKTNANILLILNKKVYDEKIRGINCLKKLNT